MIDVMIDLETLGLRPGCEIIEVGAVVFDPRGTEIDPVGLSVLTEFDLMKADPYVLAWWNNQPPEVRGQTLFALPRHPLRFALELLTEYLRATCFEAVWCYGAQFDFPIITAAYEQQGQWESWPKGFLAGMANSDYIKSCPGCKATRGNEFLAETLLIGGIEMEPFRPTSRMQDDYLFTI